MPYRIAKEFHFSASHQIPNLPDGHPCGRLHGHNYRVEIVLEGSALDEAGFILDYGELKEFGGFIDRVLDHKHLNAVLTLAPTAENLARHLYEVAQEVYQETLLARGARIALVRVSETPKTWAEYIPGRLS